MNNPQTIFYFNAEEIRLRGLVQGVGLRPTVYRIARQLGIEGEVINDSAGVKVTLQAGTPLIDQFIQQLESECPPLARIDSIERSATQVKQPYTEFSIRKSQQGVMQTSIVADATTCPECLVDIQSPQNRRHAYAFTNCTHCGPRLSIVERIPYDRCNTSMKSFELCPECQQEYSDPGNRRFHAQPNACPVCGPFLRLTDATGEAVPSDDILIQTAKLIKHGHILAIKGIGGFQLACDASNDDTVKLLRARKHRPAKALALMAKDLQQVRQYCFVSEDEQALLTSTAAPIVVLEKSNGANSLSTSLAPDQNSLGFMLPYSPLHHILMRQLDIPIVLTSGNASAEPQCIDNQQAIHKLGDIADYFILHNRDIINRIDDSVVRVIHRQKQFYRRARGYAPTPINIPISLPEQQSILALGGEMKNTFCILKGHQATLSQHMGNLENLQTYYDYLKNLELYKNLFEIHPAAIVIDKHPEYLSSKLGRQWASEMQIPLIEIQHHHAHIAACLADNGWTQDQGAVIGVAMDGLGLGDDGTIWGGEFLLANYAGYTRLGCLKPVALPGGTKAILEPWRNTYAQLACYQPWNQIVQQYAQLPLVEFLQQQPTATLDKMIQCGLNSPLSSSCGRLFDAVAAALGICRSGISYEGQAAIELEASITLESLQCATPYAFEIEYDAISQINLSSLWSCLLQDLARGFGPALISSRFHLTLAQIFLQMVLNIRQNSNINTVALSGGVFQNTTLFQLTYDLLAQHSFEVLSHQHVPANDGGLSLGQAVIAATRLQADAC